MAVLKVFTLCCLYNVVCGQTEVRVETSYGPILGSDDTFSGRTVRRFRGVPFAKPPVGNLRFLSPVEPEPWTEPIQTKSYSPACIQYSPNPMMNNTSEDCLYLNVFAPPGAQNLPVMVWIHGGSLHVGSASNYHGETLASVGQVIVVTISYRLNVFGFFSTGDSVSEGNAGLHDQVMALKWVKNNIDKFGGDPTQVTIFGESAGAWSVNMHMVSPLSRGLFHRAISESGNTYGIPITSQATRGEASIGMAAPLDCSPVMGSFGFLACMQGKTTAEVLMASQQTEATMTPYLGMTPITYGDSFLPKLPREYWDKGDINPADCMMGVNSEDGTVIFGGLAEDTRSEYLQDGIDVTSPFYYQYTLMAVKIVSLMASNAPSDPVWSAMKDEFFTHPPSDKLKNLRALLDVFSDGVFLGPTMNCIHKMAETSNQKAYLYYFNQVIQPTGEIPKGHLATKVHYTGNPELELGAGHMAEIAYLLGHVSEDLPEMPGNIYHVVSENDRLVGRSMMNAWLSFAKTG